MLVIDAFGVFTYCLLENSLLTIVCLSVIINM